VLSQSAYDDLDFENKLKCARIAFGTTTDEPSLTSPNWRVYAQKGTDADVWTIGSDGYWYKNGTKYTDAAHPNGIKAEGEDGTGVQLKGSVNVLYHSATETSLEDLTGVQVGDCYVVDANRHIYFYNGSSSAFPANWNDLGEFRGQKGDNSYMHIAYADDVTFDSQGNPTSCTGFTTVKQKEAYDWIGLCTDNTATDPTDYMVYAWNYVKGTDGKDADNVRPNILLRTVFDRGMPFVKEKWIANGRWDCVSIPTSTPDTEVEGRLSVRLNAGALNDGEYVDFGQDVFRSLKTGTWYTLSFNYSSTHPMFTYLWSGVNTKTGIDTSAGVYVDGELMTAYQDGVVEWNARWDMQRHTLTFKTASSCETNSFYILFRIHHYQNIVGGVEQHDRGQAAICMVKLEEGKTATAYMANEDDLKGEDAWRIAANPANVIITQGMDNNVGVFTTAEVTFSASKGNVNADIVTLSNIAWEHFTGTVDNINKKVIVTSPTPNGGTYYTEGWFSVTVEVRDPNTNAVLPFPVKILCYANLLGSWKTKVIGDTETSVAQKLTYGYDPTHQGDPIALQNFGTYIRSSEVNISEIKATRSREDLFNFGLNNWTVNDVEYSDADFDKDYPRYWDKSEVYSDIYSPVVSLKPGVYCFSAYVHGDFDTSSNSIALQQGCSVEIPGDGTTISASDIGVVTGDTIKVDGTTYQRKYAIFEIAGSEALCSVNLWGNTYGDVVRPKLEKGSAPTPWQTTVSQIKQTANEIDLSITNKLGETGIHIDGEQRKIELKADNTIVDGSFTAPNINSIGEGTYSQIIGGHFELGIVKESNAQQPAFLLETDNNGNAVLRYLDKDGNTIGVIDSSFFNQSAVGDTWTEYRGVTIEHAGTQPTFEEVQRATNTGQGYVYYQFHEGYVNNGTYKTYNVSRSSSPSKYDGKWFKGKATKHGTDYNFASPMDGGFYIKPKTIPFATLTEDGKVVHVYNVQSALFNRFDNTTEIVDIEIDDDN
jgi:hypothetical protein